MIAGAFSGFLTCVLLQPFDRCKTLLQTTYKGRGLCNVFVTTYTTFGVRGLWLGLQPSLLRTVPGVGVYFYSLDIIRQHLAHGSDKHLGVSSDFIAGACSRMVVALTSMPLTIIKTRSESGLYKYSGVFRTTKSIFQTEGLIGLFRGTLATNLRDVPFSGIYIVLYIRMQHLLHEGSSLPLILVSMIAGTGAGAVGNFSLI